MPVRAEGGAERLEREEMIICAINKNTEKGGFFCCIFLRLNTDIEEKETCHPLPYRRLLLAWSGHVSIVLEGC